MSKRKETDAEKVESDNPLLDLPSDKQEALITFYEQNHESDDSVSRRGFLGAAGGLLAGTTIGGGAYALSSEEVAAATAAVGQVGEPGNTVDVYGDAVTANSVDTENLNNRVQVSSGEDVQARVNDAGQGAVVEFEDGVYPVDSLTPIDYQKWVVGPGVKFQPSSDAPAIDTTGVVHVSFDGGIHISDPNNTTTSSEAFRSENNGFNDFGAVYVTGTYDGVRFDGSGGGTNNNSIGPLWIDDTRNFGLVARSEVHDNTFGPVWLTGGGVAGNSDGLNWSTQGVDGGNRFGSVLSLDWDGNNVTIADGEVEMWFESLIVDKGSSNGLAVTGPISRLFIGRLWASTNDNNGIDLAPGAGNVIDDITIGEAYTWNNTNSGVLGSNGTVKRLHIGHLNSNNNNTDATGTNPNLQVANTFEQAYIGSLVSYGGDGVDVTGTVTDGHIGRAFVDDGMDYTSWTSVDGDPMADDLTARTGLYAGERAYHDGTDGTNTNRSEPATWTGSDWEGELSGSVIA